jgi:hypothetical protein
MNFLMHLLNWLNKKTVVIGFFVLMSVVSSLSLVLRGPNQLPGGTFTYYNNYLIFKYSFEHLEQAKELYTHYQDQHFDRFKYTPTFAAFFGVFYYFPDYIGLTLWNLLNSLVLLFSIYFIPKSDIRTKNIMGFIILMEMITSLLNLQSNALIAGFIIFSFGFMERGKSFWASLFLVAATFIKFFSVIGFALFLFYPGKIKQFLYTLFWFFVFLLIPLLFVDMETYLQYYQSYFDLLAKEKITQHTYSFIRLFEIFGNIQINKILFSLVGGLAFMLPFAFIKQYQIFKYRGLMLASVLLWVVIFNYRAESPTFILAMTGVALWFALSDKNKWDIAFLVLAIIFTSLSLTDFMPKPLREEIIKPYAVKVIPCVMIWFRIMFDLLSIAFKNQQLKKPGAV